jgi:hypothetical protein
VLVTFFPCPLYCPPGKSHPISGLPIKKRKMTAHSPDSRAEPPDSPFPLGKWGPHDLVMGFAHLAAVNEVTRRASEVTLTFAKPKVKLTTFHSVTRRASEGKPLGRSFALRVATFHSGCSAKARFTFALSKS